MALWCYLAGFWAFLGASGPLLDTSWAHLGRFWGDLGPLVRGLERIFAPNGLPDLDFEGSAGMPNCDFVVFEGLSGVRSDCGVGCCV